MMKWHINLELWPFMWKCDSLQTDRQLSLWAAMRSRLHNKAEFSTHHIVLKLKRSRKCINSKTVLIMNNIHLPPCTSRLDALFFTKFDWNPFSAILVVISFQQAYRGLFDLIKIEIQVHTSIGSHDHRSEVVFCTFWDSEFLKTSANHSSVYIEGSEFNWTIISNHLQPTWFYIQFFVRVFNFFFTFSSF